VQCPLTATVIVTASGCLGVIWTGAFLLVILGSWALKSSVTLSCLLCTRRPRGCAARSCCIDPSPPGFCSLGKASAGQGDRCSPAACRDHSSGLVADSHVELAYFQMGLHTFSMLRSRRSAVGRQGQTTCPFVSASFRPKQPHMPIACIHYSRTTLL
jgi:hypothetical protein